MTAPTRDVLHVKDPGQVSDLQQRPYRVHDATDAESVLAVLDDTTVDAVLCDATREDDRLDVLDAIADAASGTPVLVRSPTPDGELASKATARGAEAYCTTDDDVGDRIEALREREEDRIDPALERNDDYTDAHHERDDSQWYRRLYESVTDGETDVEATARRLLEIGRDRLDLPYGFLTRFEGDEQHVVAAVGDHEALQPTRRISLSESYCKYTAATDGGFLGLADAKRDSPDPSVYESIGLGCYVGGMVAPAGDTYGSLCFAGDAARDREFTDDDRTFVELTVELLEHELERRAHHRTLEATRERYERAVERIDDGFFALDDDWRFTYVNAYAARLLESDPETLVGENVWECYPGDTAAAFRERYERAMAEQEPVVFEERFDAIDTWFEVSAYPSPDGLSVHIKDVTRRKERERKVRSLLSAVKDLYGERDRDAVAHRVVDATQHILGHDYVVARLYDAETNTLPVTASTDHVDANMADRPTYEPGDPGVGTAFETGDVLERDGDFEPFSSARYYPLGDHGVVSVGIQADDDVASQADQRLTDILFANATAALDLADRQRVLERYESVLENVQDMVFVLDDDGTFEYVTEPLATTLDVARDALDGRHASEIVTASADAVVDATAGLLEGDRDESTLRTELDADDRQVPVRVEFSALPGDDRGVVGVVHDVSDLAETRARLETENERFRYLFETLPDPVVENRFVDGEPIVERVNPAFERVFGYDAEAVVGHSINDFIVPDDRMDEARSLDETLEPDEPGDESVVSREVVRETATGDRNFLFRGISYLEGDSHRGYGIYTDITPQRERERRLKVLHTVLRHNLRTEMTLVAGYVDELAREADDDAVVDHIHAAVDEVVELGDKARDLERILAEPTDADELDLDRRVENAVEEIVHDRVARTADASPDDETTAVRSADEETSTVHVDTEAVTVIADHRVETVVANLVENAIEHGDGDVAVTVTSDDETARVRVSDDGDGVPDFERELVTGERDITQLEHGSGLGLWIANWLLEAFEGDLRFEEDGEKSSVVAELPRASDEGSEATESDREEVDESSEN